MSNSGLLCTEEQNSLNVNTELKRKPLKKCLLRTISGIIFLWIMHFNNLDDVNFANSTKACSLLQANNEICNRPTYNGYKQFIIQK
jgi:hypothetical protein